jgi:hypothetical protein
VERGAAFVFPARAIQLWTARATVTETPTAGS